MTDGQVLATGTLGSACLSVRHYCEISLVTDGQVYSLEPDARDKGATSQYRQVLYSPDTRNVRALMSDSTFQVFQLNITWNFTLNIVSLICIYLSKCSLRKLTLVRSSKTILCWASMTSRLPSRSMHCPSSWASGISWLVHRQVCLSLEFSYFCVHVFLHLCIWVSVCVGIMANWNTKVK